MNALHLATLALAAILVIAALGKLRQDDGTTREEWRELRVPEALNVPVLRRLHPYVELGVVALALLPGPFAALGAAGMLALTLGYAAAIIGAWRRPESVTCACFGSARRTEITGRTVVRNVLLVVLAVCAAIAALLSAGGPLGALTASAGEDVRIHGPLAAVMVLLVLAAGWFSAAPTGASAESAELAPGPQPEVSGVEDEMGDYLRTLTPRAPVVEADGTRTDL
ncbi:MAG: MauE/DoxX family redox-associated membrane protein, partial [Brachybacterium sp.]|nr:MauE/DoxX family redox-associated membrane protein [Brachybacterium sp.]